MAIINQYVLQDRSLSTKWALKVTDSELYYESTSLDISIEPIIEDDVSSGSYWKLFIDDGEIGIETTATVQDDNIQLRDTSTSIIWKLVIDDEQPGLENLGVLATPGTRPTYDIDPDYVYSEEIGLRVNVIEFNSGKEKRIKRGTKRRQFTLRYDRVTDSKRNAVVTFFTDVSGALQTLSWTNPLDSTAYTCRLAEDSLVVSEPAPSMYNIALTLSEET